MVVSDCFSLPREHAVAPVRTWLQLVPVSQHPTDARFSRWTQTSLATCFSHLLVLLRPCRLLCHLVFFRKTFRLHAFEAYSIRHPRSKRLGRVFSGGGPSVGFLASRSSATPLRAPCLGERHLAAVVGTHFRWQPFLDGWHAFRSHLRFCCRQPRRVPAGDMTRPVVRVVLWARRRSRSAASSRCLCRATRAFGCVAVGFSACRRSAASSASLPVAAASTRLRRCSGLRPSHVAHAEGALVRLPWRRRSWLS